MVLQEDIAAQNVDLVFLTETWAQEDETVALKQLAPSGFSVLHQTQIKERGGTIINIRPLPTTKMTGVDWVDGVSAAEKSLSVCLVY